jgi:hypothetical protein
MDGAAQVGSDAGSIAAAAGVSNPTARRTSRSPEIDDHEGGRRQGATPSCSRRRARPEWTALLDDVEAAPLPDECTAERTKAFCGERLEALAELAAELD